MKSPSRVVVVPDDARVVRAQQVRWMVAAHGARGAARRLGLDPTYVSRIARGERSQDARPSSEDNGNGQRPVE